MGNNMPKVAPQKFRLITIKHSIILYLAGVKNTTIYVLNLLQKPQTRLNIKIVPNFPTFTLMVMQKILTSKPS